MRLNLSTSRPSPRAFQSGVALIVTVIMISVITFLTVAFLALSGREKNSVKARNATVKNVITEIMMTVTMRATPD